VLTILAFIVTLGILVTVHEYGHFQVAKWCGVKVIKFSVGFGKPLWSKKFGQDQTEFVIAAIPLGGYVKMLGEEQFTDEHESPEQDMSRALNQQSVGKRMAIVLAGPLANLLLAIILYWALFMTGTIGIKPIVGNLIENSPAAISKITPGDLIQKINGTNVATWQDVRWTLLNETLKKELVEIQVIDNKNEIHVHQLNLSKLDNGDIERDVLDKLGLTIYQPNMHARVGEIVKGGAADIANFKAGDLVLTVNNNDITGWDAFVEQIKKHPKQALQVVVARGADKVSLSVTPDAVNENGKVIGRIGAGVQIDQPEMNQLLVVKHFTVAEAFVSSIEKTWQTSIFSLKMLGNMLLGNVSWKGISGPVSIASYAGQSANMGVKVFIGFLALVSISIGILNLLPIPILDGGHFMYYMVEFLTGKPVSETIVNIGQKIGLFILGWMMVLALYNDMDRLITG
jgi:regulator of sigma E protease